MIWGLAYAAVGVLMIGWASFNWLRARMSRKWPATIGQVRGSTDTSSETFGGPVTTWRRPRYLYEVSHKLFTGSREYFGDESLAKSRAELLLDGISPGARVPVYYNPRRPDDAVLNTSTHPKMRVVAVAGAALIAFAPVINWLEHHPSALHGTPIDWVAIGVAVTVVSAFMQRR